MEADFSTYEFDDAKFVERLEGSLIPSMFLEDPVESMVTGEMAEGSDRQEATDDPFLDQMLSKIDSDEDYVTDLFRFSGRFDVSALDSELHVVGGNSDGGVFNHNIDAFFDFSPGTASPVSLSAQPPANSKENYHRKLEDHQEHAPRLSFQSFHDDQKRQMAPPPMPVGPKQESKKNLKMEVILPGSEEGSAGVSSRDLMPAPLTVQDPEQLKRKLYYGCTEAKNDTKKIRQDIQIIPSRFCHVCARTAKTARQIVCSNIRLGTCRKVICEKCFERFEWNWDLAAKGSDWICTHCVGVCPDRAQCSTYCKVNEKLRKRRAGVKGGRGSSTGIIQGPPSSTSPFLSPHSS